MKDNRFSEVRREYRFHYALSGPAEEKEREEAEELQSDIAVFLDEEQAAMAERSAGKDIFSVSEFAALASLCRETLADHYIHDRDTLSGKKQYIYHLSMNHPLRGHLEAARAPRYVLHCGWMTEIGTVEKEVDCIFSREDIIRLYAAYEGMDRISLHSWKDMYTLADKICTQAHWHSQLSEDRLAGHIRFPDSKLTTALAEEIFSSFNCNVFPLCTQYYTMADGTVKTIDPYDSAVWLLYSKAEILALMNHYTREKDKTCFQPMLNRAEAQIRQYELYWRFSHEYAMNNMADLWDQRHPESADMEGPGVDEMFSLFRKMSITVHLPTFQNVCQALLHAVAHCSVKKKPSEEISDNGKETGVRGDHISQEK